MHCWISSVLLYIYNIKKIALLASWTLLLNILFGHLLASERSRVKKYVNFSTSSRCIPKYISTFSKWHPEGIFTNLYLKGRDEKRLTGEKVEVEKTASVEMGKNGRGGKGCATSVFSFLLCIQPTSIPYSVRTKPADSWSTGKFYAFILTDGLDSFLSKINIISAGHEPS